MDNITSFDDVYCLNQTIKQDQRLSKIPVFKYYSLCWKYLQFAISYFQYDCLPSVGKDIPKILDNVPYWEMDYEFIGNKVDNEFLLEPSPYEDCLFYVSFQKTEDGEWEELKEYEYDKTTSILKVNISPEYIYEFMVVAYKVGSFNDTLDYREKVILAEGMNLPYLEETTNDYRLRKQMIYNDSSRIHSQANHLEVNSKVEEIQRIKVDRLIADYSYRSNKEKYIGLGGKHKYGGIR